MPRGSGNKSATDLLADARKLGADEAKIVKSKDIVVDRRVRLKCMVPVCEGYGKHLLCPPSTMSVDEFSKIVGLYKRGILVQVIADVDSVDKSDRSLNRDISRRLERQTNTVKWERRLHSIVNRLEALAFKEGYYLAAGLIGSSCTLCKQCVEPASGERCRHPFEARPSMQSMGIDVVATCRKSGLPLDLSSSKKVRWTGLVLLD